MSAVKKSYWRDYNPIVRFLRFMIANPMALAIMIAIGLTYLYWQTDLQNHTYAYLMIGIMLLGIILQIIKLDYDMWKEDC